MIYWRRRHCASLPVLKSFQQTKQKTPFRTDEFRHIKKTPTKSKPQAARLFIRCHFEFQKGSRVWPSIEKVVSYIKIIVLICISKICFAQSKLFWKIGLISPQYLSFVHHISRHFVFKSVQLNGQKYTVSFFIHFTYISSCCINILMAYAITFGRSGCFSLNIAHLSVILATILNF